MRVIDAVIGPGAGQGCFLDGTDGFKGHDAGVVHVLQYETWSGGVHWDRRSNSGPGPRTRSKPVVICGAGGTAGATRERSSVLAGRDTAHMEWWRGDLYR